MYKPFLNYQEQHDDHAHNHTAIRVQYGDASVGIIRAISDNPGSAARPRYSYTVRMADGTEASFRTYLSAKMFFARHIA
jgi:hypothetical protein